MRDWLWLRNQTPPFCKWTPDMANLVGIMGNIARRRPDVADDDADPGSSSRPVKPSRMPTPIPPPPGLSVKAKPQPSRPQSLVLSPTSKLSRPMPPPGPPPATPGPEPQPDAVAAEPVQSLPDDLQRWVQHMAASASVVAASAMELAKSVPPNASPELGIDMTALTRAVTTAVEDSLSSDNVMRRLKQTSWYDKKRQRAELNAAVHSSTSKSSASSSAPPARTTPKPPMCKQCDRAQPGSYCCRFMCRPCCIATARRIGEQKCEQPQHLL
jgi:hypothetical protein